MNDKTLSNPGRDIVMGILETFEAETGLVPNFEAIADHLAIKLHELGYMLAPLQWNES